ncbi:lipid A biosynthesis (KDO)2-(lauroyl)-lipid IVA acyltransferase [Grimontia sp. S25]|uniref:Lipid A biosynthesis (KDO)2-(Lauroyl)-lipid IVA acyltransferase n=1 Tax=Grimontia sedimenti TaxID=2711294 RepID=A0A6M1RNY1_9GAMM|nr:lipid A biosynthesis (KDO)2-(lauroyl)-lipid IVA acyltransferase [Grimontia sedimenti]NGN99189.1 lipid A biosynthesis (KDO)2-(lauroyl)-lipid IVA acyltransferase [Grimontia sedimenti]
MSPAPIDQQTYNPTFSWRYLTPKYWGTWIVVFLGALFSLLPPVIHKFMALGLSRAVSLSKSGSVHRTRVNLSLCFPEKSQSEREFILRKQFCIAISYLLRFPLISLRSKKWLNNRVTIHGLNHLENSSQNNTILLVPHTWSIDVPAIYLASHGLPVAAFAKKQKNSLLDWLMHRQRVQYGGAVCERNQGIKPFIKAVRSGYLGYYLPDEDLGEKHSVFVDFFGTTKATMSGLYKLAKVSQAKIVPLYATFNIDSGNYEMELFEPIILTGDESDDARLLNIFIEQQVLKNPEQYMWILPLLKTRSDNMGSPYRKPSHT